MERGGKVSWFRSGKNLNVIVNNSAFLSGDGKEPLKTFFFFF